MDKRPRWPMSVRARTTVAATTVVAVALAVTGVIVVALLRDNLVGNAELRSKYTAQSVAELLSAGTAPSKLELPDDDDELVQVVDADGKVIAAGEALRGAGPVGDFAPHAPAEATPTPGSDDDDDDGDDEDDDSTGATDGDIGDSMASRTVDVPGEDDRYQFVAVSLRTPQGEELRVYSGVTLSTEDEAIQGVTDTMWFVLPALLGVVALVTWLMTGRALRPVSAIRAELSEITAGDLSRRVPEPSARDEIYALARTTNQTLEALDSAVSQQRRFIADASHELRSPLAILRTQLEVAASHPELLDVDATLSDVIRLQRLATDLLLLARLDAGERPGHSTVDLTELVRETVARRAAGDRIPVGVNVAEEVTVTGVQGQLERVLTNLLDNAQRHASAAVSVTLDTGPGGARLQVTDDGPGVPESDRQRVFDRFVRLDDARSRDAGGAGLGLAIVRDVVQAHHGTISVTDAERSGARFTVTLPRPA